MIKPCGKALYSFQNLTFVNLNQSSFHLGLLTMDRASFFTVSPPHSPTLSSHSTLLHHSQTPISTMISNGNENYQWTKHLLLSSKKKKKKSSLLYLNTWSLCPLYAFLYWKNTLELHYKVPIWSINLCGAHFV